jgi:molybdate transport system substrate-binding protein
MKVRWNLLLLIFGAAVTTTAVQAAEVKVIAANAVKDGYASLAESFEKASGHKVVTTWTGTVNATKRVSGGEIFDLIIIGSDNIDQLVAAGKVAAGGRTDFAKVGVGVAVRAGLPKPDISTPDALRTTVLNAGSIAHSAGPSGAFVAQLLKGLGVAEQVASKVKQPSSGAEVAALVARGEVDLGFGQVSEFLNVEGLTDLGSLPESIQNYTIYAIGRHSAAPSPDAAIDFIKFLTSPDAAPAIRKMGMQPGQAQSPVR